MLLTKCFVVTCSCRMLSDTAEHREAMLSHGALKSVATLLHSDDTTLLLSAIKTVSCFIHGLERFYLYDVHFAILHLLIRIINY